jgi:hypothetical protein
MKNILPTCFAVAALLFAACEAKVNTTPGPTTERTNTIVTPGAPAKTENNTTVVNPSPAPSKTETNTNTTVSPGGVKQSTTTETK